MVAGVTESPLAWSLVIPVKVLARAKSRLADLAGPARSALALAMAADTVSAAVACPAVAAVIVVTDDAAAAGALGALGAHVLPDEPAAGLNPALAHGAAVAAARWPGSGTAGLAADLPALRPAELERGLRAAAQWPEAFVADASGTGTTLYTARPPGRSGRDSAPGQPPGTGRAGRWRSCWQTCRACAVTWIPPPTCARPPASASARAPSPQPPSSAELLADPRRA